MWLIGALYPKKGSSIIKRNIFLYLFLVLVTMTLGLLSRSGLIPLANFVTRYAGDTLWALMVFWLICIARPSSRTSFVLCAAVLFAFSIEFSQLYHAPWIDAIRNNRFGGLVLGFGFKSSDLICYSVGILLGALADSMFLRKFNANTGITK